MTDKTKIYAFLDSKQIPYEITEHKAVYNIEELSAVDLPYPEDDAKNLFVRDDKRKNYYLITVKGDKRVNLKEFRRAHGTKPLTFASAEDLLAIMKLSPGAVSPFWLLNDDEKQVEFYLDQSFLEDNAKIGCHPNDNTATVWLRSEDLLKIIEEHGNIVHVAEL